METWAMAPARQEGMKPNLWTENDGAGLCQVLLDIPQ